MVCGGFQAYSSDGESPAKVWLGGRWHSSVGTDDGVYSSEHMHVSGQSAQLSGDGQMLLRAHRWCGARSQTRQRAGGRHRPLSGMASRQFRWEARFRWEAHPPGKEHASSHSVPYMPQRPAQSGHRGLGRMGVWMAALGSNAGAYYGDSDAEEFLADGSRRTCWSPEVSMMAETLCYIDVIDSWVASN